MFNKIKRGLAVAAVAFTGSVAMADPTPLAQFETALTGLAPTIAAAVLAVMIAGLAIFSVKLGGKVILGAASSVFKRG